MISFNIITYQLKIFFLLCLGFLVCPRKGSRSVHLEAEELLRQVYQRPGGGQGQPAKGKQLE